MKNLSVFSDKQGENALKDTPGVLQELASTGASSNIQTLLKNVGSVGADEVLSLDPGDKQEGFRELESWVEGSLDMYRVSYLPLLPWVRLNRPRSIARVPTHLVAYILPLLPGPSSVGL